MSDIFVKITELDHKVLLFIQNHMRCDFLNPVMEISSLLVNAGILWILISLGLICFKRTRMIGVVSLSSLAFCFLINNVIIKNVVARARPFDTFNDLVPLITKPKDYSFASGHTACSFAASGVLCRFFNKPLAVVTACYAVLVAYSRLYLGVHYPTDVLCGFLIGIIGSLVVYHFYARRFDLEKYSLKPHKAEEN